MHVFISGGTGFVGSHLVPALLDRGDEVTLVVRRETDTSRVDPRAKQTLSREAVAGADAVVNLAGAGVMDRRWTPERLEVIRSSRVETTRALARAATSAQVFVSASAVGIYGMRMDDVALDESSRPADDDLARICVAWEEATAECVKGCRVANPRIGIVLGSNGGALTRMVPLYRRFMGGPIGSGKQWWSWVHIDDVVGALLFALDGHVSGPFNLTAPEPATMEQVASTLARVMHRPNALRVPEFALRAALGPGAEVILTGQRVLPRKLIDAHYPFLQPDLERALRSVV